MSSSERYTFDLLDSNDQLIRTLRKTEGGTITLNVNAEIRGAGSVVVTDESEIHWQSARLRCWFERGDVKFPIGTFIPTVDSEDRAPEAKTFKVEIHDKTTILVEDQIVDTYAVNTGDNVVQKVVDIIIGAGETSVVIEESSQTVLAPMVWDIGTTKLRIVNDLLDYINYFSIWTDGMGVFRSSPYRRPADRPTARTFEKGESAVHSPRWTKESSSSDIPNRVVIVPNGDEENELTRGLAENTDPDSDYSYDGRGGRWVVHSETGVDVATSADAQKMAERRLDELSRPSSTLQISHLVLPLNLSDVVGFISDDTNLKLVVEKMTFRMKPGSLCSAVWRGVSA